MAPVRQFYPRSLLRLILLGNVLVALPLLVAIVFVFFNIGQLTDRSEALTREASLASRHGHELIEELHSMERILRQHQVLGDASLLDDYGVVHQEWQTVCREFAAIPLLVALGEPILVILDNEAQAYAALRSGRKTSGEALVDLIELRRQTSKIIETAQQLANGEIDAFRATVDHVRQRLLLAMALGLAVLGLLIISARPWLGRVLWGFEHAVQALGEGNLDDEIRLAGPADIREVGRRLDWLRCRLKALEEQRTLVLRHVSHELKTPLAALREGASLLNERAAGPLNQGQEKIVDIMSGNALRLQGLIDSLLKLQQAGHAGERIEQVRLRFDDLIQQVVTTHQLTARDKHLRFSGALSPLTVVGGREELTTVVNNLVANAIKFSPAGGAVNLSLIEKDDRVILDITDQGPGIPANEREHIFEPFYRSGNAKGVAGVGLGLAIAREFAVAHRGTLELLAASVGSHFRLTLPSAEASA
jgi:two-component system sensor histidine kinase GlrK